MLEVPVYLITGFLESGKTTFIQEVLSSPDFADGARTLLLLCEEGEIEYNKKELNRHNIEIITVEDEEDLNPLNLEVYHKKYKPVRVFVEFNGMWEVNRFILEGLPKRWEVVQTITLVDGSTFGLYLTNVRNVLNNLFSFTELVIFNRCSLDMDLQKYRRAVKALNQQVMLSFEDENGNQLELGKEQPPYDLDADVIRIEDVDYGLWFLDMTDTPDRYRGKTVQFLGKVMIPRKFSPNTFIAGRNAMTCCADDIRYIGYICKAADMSDIRQKDWIEVTAKVAYEYAQEYRGEGPVLHVISIEHKEKPKDELIYFT